jgi:4'-phosphopantetheinyl transferase
VEQPCTPDVGGTTGPRVVVWTMPLDGLTEPAISPWRELLDPEEKARADRFVFPRDRIAYISAHALTRTLLSGLVPGTNPATFHFVSVENGKPVAWVADRPAPLSFNLSHTDGMVGAAATATPGLALGFDLESLDRKVMLEVADRFFCPEEVDWLNTLPETNRPAGFLRLWTLKEAFIKATGQGLARDLASFWFTPIPPVIHFKPPLGGRPQDWWFEQREVGRSFIAAVGLDRPSDCEVTADWALFNPSDMRPSLAKSDC